MATARWALGLACVGAITLSACGSDGEPPGSVSETPPALGSGTSNLNGAQKRALQRWAAQIAAQEENSICWRRTSVRGAGEPLSSCRSGELDGALCYPECESGYDGVGPVCWARCRSGYIDDGALCRKNARIIAKDYYGRGAGYLPDDRATCREEHGSCEPYGGLVYPRCRSGYVAEGCCLCRERDCPSGYKDDGATCRRDVDIYAKRSYGRGAGTPMDCRSGLERSGALCYPRCESGFTGVGPVCWANCPSTQPVDCGAVCGKSTAQCVIAISDMVLAPIELAQNIVSAVVTGGGVNAVKSALKSALKSAAKQLGKMAVQAALRESQVFRDLSRKINRLIVTPVTRAIGSEAVGIIADAAAENILVATLIDDSDPELLDVISDIDPTGVAAVIDAFYHPTCVDDRMPNLDDYIDAKRPTNLARNRPTRQSTTVRGGPASLATDTEPAGKPSMTEVETNPWWEVELDRARWVGRIGVHRVAEGGVYPELRVSLLDARRRLVASTVLLGGTEALADASFTAPARYVKVERISAGALSLSEVEVHENRLATTFENAGWLNLAQSRPTTQSSTAGGISSLGNDGDPATVSVTTNQVGAFWQVDLGSEERLQNLIIDGELPPFDVVLLDSRLAVVNRMVVREPLRGVADYPLRGKARYVRVELRQAGVLRIAELAANAIRPNRATGKVAKQSSSLSVTNHAGRAVDGDVDGLPAKTRPTDYRPHWEVDLGDDRAITRVRLHTQGRSLPPFMVHLESEQSVCWQAGPSSRMPTCVTVRKPVASVPSSGADPLVALVGSGRFVRIELNTPGELALNEVEVF